VPQRGARARAAEDVAVPVVGCALHGELSLPAAPRGLVVLAHPVGAATFTRRQRALSRGLANAGFATLLLDLLTEREEAWAGALLGDAPLLAERLSIATNWLEARVDRGRLPWGYLGVGAGATAAFVLAAVEPGPVSAIVALGANPASAGASMLLSDVPTLFLLAGDDPARLAATRAACAHGQRRRLELIEAAQADPGAPWVLDRVGEASVAWFSRWLDPLAVRKSV
jgi:dienelactone hydrolase